MDGRTTSGHDGWREGRPPPREPDRKAGSRGFTLIELLVVLALMGLMAALISPRVQSALPGLELRTATRDLASALRATRAEAIRSGGPAALTLDIDTGRYTAADINEPMALPEGTEVKALLAANDLGPQEQVVRYRFYPDGTALGGRITLSRGDSTYRIDIDWMTGRVRILDSPA